MKQHILNTYKKVYPFIDKDFGGDVYIDKMNDSLLKDKFWNYYWDGAGGCEYRHYRIDFVKKDGGIIKDAVIIGSYEGSNFAHSITYEKEGESIVEAIDRLKIENEINYVVIYKNGYRSWVGQKYKEWNSVNVFKVPEGYVSKYIQELKDEIEKEIKEETSKI